MGLLNGCGEKEVTENVTLLSVASENDYIANTINNTVERYARDNNLLYKQRQINGEKPEDIEAEIQSAVEAGADVIVCRGTIFEVAIYNAQSQYKNVKFIIIDGAPRKAEGKKYQVRKNTQVIIYAEEQGGFLAGYAAVKDGYKNLGFIGGVPSESVIRYGSGYVQGANYAAEEMGLAKDKIIVRFMYIGNNNMSPALMEMAGQWYDDGCEVIFTSGGTIGTAVMKAAEQKDAKVIGVDTDQSKDSDTVITSVIKEIEGTLYSSLKSVYNDEFKGKKVEAMNVADGGIALAIDTAQFVSFTQQDYSAIIEKMTSKDFKLSGEDAKTIYETENGFESITVEME